ncbi:MAG: peptidoglycan editing factor PgeF [Candidatus Atelocyanobacterium thalassa]
MVTDELTANWQWKILKGSPYLTCSLLSKWTHGFFTRSFYPLFPEEIGKFFHLNITNYQLKQVHSNLILSSDEIDKFSLNSRLLLGDGIISNKKEQALWVASADCVPILIGDCKTGYVAAVHAGWKGTAQRVVPEAIIRLQAWGSSIENLYVAMGPAISGRVYQVSETVATKILTSLFNNKKAYDINDMLEFLHNTPNIPVFFDHIKNKFYISIAQVNQIQLEQLGVQKNKISIAPYCTYQSSSNFFSYRRTNARQIQWSGIISDT